MWHRVSFIPFASIVGLILLLVGLIMYGQWGRTAFNHTNGIFRASLGPNYASNPMAAWAMHAYHAAYVSMVVIGVFILVLTVVILAWRLIQHLRSRSAGSRGAGSHAQNMTLEGLTRALGFILYGYCVFLFVFTAIMALIYAAVYIGYLVSHFADAGFASTLKPLLDQWLNNANVSYQALNQLLSTVPEIGSNAASFTNTAFSALVPTPTAIASYLNNHTGNRVSYLINQVLVNSGTPGQCGSACIDLSQYPFMNTNACICNSPSVGQIAVSAKAARHDYMIAIIGLLITFLGCLLLLARLTALASMIHYDSRLMYGNRSSMGTGQNGAASAGMADRNSHRPNGTVNGSSSQYVI